MSGIGALSPFRTRSFRFQWPADLFTAWALEMETLILGWFVLVETGSVGLLTLFGSLQFVGTLVSPVLGMLGDRLGLRNVLAAMRLSYAVFASIILTLALTGQLQPLAVLIVAAMSGMVRPTDIGLRSALVGATVPPAHLTAAIGISRTTMDSAKVGGALAGTGFMALFGMAPAYIVIVCLYMIGAMLTMMTDGRPATAAAGPSAVSAAGTTPATKPAPTSAWRDLKEGMVYIWRTPRLLAAMSLAALVNLCAFPFTGGLLPYIARNVFELDQQGLGTLAASFSGGALVGSLIMSVWGPRLPAGRTMVLATLAWFACLLGFVLSSQLAVAILMLIGAGIAQSLSMLPLAIVLLRTSDPQYRGRIMGVRMLAIYPLPLGLLIAGALIPGLGYLATGLLMLALGLLLTAALAWTWSVDILRRDAQANAT